MISASILVLHPGCTLPTSTTTTWLSTADFLTTLTLARQSCNGKLLTFPGSSNSSLILKSHRKTLNIPRDERRAFHQNLVRSIALAEGGLGEAFIFMKTKFPPAANKAILADFDYTGSKMNKTLDVIDDAVKMGKKYWQEFADAIPCIKICAGLFGFFRLTRLLFVASIYVELIKDSSLMAALINIEQDNGIALFEMTFTQVLTIVMGLSVVIPLAVSAIETAWRRPYVILGCEPWIR